MQQNPNIKILFTKDLSQEWIAGKLDPSLDFSIRPALKIELISSDQFENRIIPEIKKYLISSQNSVKAISKLNLDGEFYVVGQKTAEFLRNSNFNVVQVADYAIDLAALILDNETPQTWNFFCGNNRRDELVEILGNEGHKLNEIICYNSYPQDLKVRSEAYTGFVFFSPLSVKTYFENNFIPKGAIVFSIGNTTTGELKKHTENTIITSEVSEMEHLIQTINKFYVGNE